MHLPPGQGSGGWNRRFQPGRLESASDPAFSGFWTDVSNDIPGTNHLAPTLETTHRGSFCDIIKSTASAPSLLKKGSPGAFQATEFSSVTFYDQRSYIFLSMTFQKAG